ncbi:AIG1 domain-containing protein [Ceratobasidium sp. AG-Ba]|nr:AIG1 domain-containing protein [Ceratobasidium sp. AG-Ba]QRW06693.1 AIG1 domain-containing protein [Ceratobasidium sp. AG-Ba]
MGVASHYIRLSRKTFKLVDTPGFDNLALSNIDVFTMLGKYLLDKNRVRVGFGGIIYIHRAEDPLESRTLAQNMGVISDVFLGDSGMTRLVIMVVPPISQAHEPAYIDRISRSEVFQSAQSKGAQIVKGTLDQNSIGSILLLCSARGPLLLRAQVEAIQNPLIALQSQIQERLGYFEAGQLEGRLASQQDQQLAFKNQEIQSLSARIAETDAKNSELSKAHSQTTQELTNSQTQNVKLCETLRVSREEYDSLLSQLQHQESCDQEIASLKMAVKQSESKLSDYDRAYKQTKQQLLSVREEAAGLHQQLQQIQSEYASLRSHLQLQENTEQSDVVRAMSDLNRSIDDIGRLISEYLFDHYIPKLFDKSPREVTSLDAYHLPELKVLLGHVGGRPSLVLNSNETGMPGEDFLDYAIRSLVCKHLCKRIFGPFHPAVNSSVNTAISNMYGNIQQQDPQPVAGRWRASTFNNMHKYESPEAITQEVDLVVQEFLNGSLAPLVLSFFGEKSGVDLERHHLDGLIKLFRTAWDLNSMLKGEVIMLGDFYPTYYSPTHRFDANLMAEFEPASSDLSHTGPILGTLGLGLLVSRAVGDGKPPDVTVILKATVATTRLYA